MLRRWRIDGIMAGMLVTSRRGRWALNLPLMVSGFGAFASFGAVASIRDEGGAGAWGLGLLAAAVVLLAVSHFRLMRVHGTQLRIAAPFGGAVLTRAEVALGIAVQRSSRGSTYTVYAQQGTTRRDLTDTLSEAGARRCRDRLAATLLDGRGDSAARSDSEQRVHAAEARWKAADAHALAVIAEHRARPPSRWILIVSVVSLLVGVLVAALLAR